MKYPEMAILEQRFDKTKIDNIYNTVIDELKKINIKNRVKKGETVAITAGSRGIANIVDILKAVVDFFKGLDASPFIFPAMGSHGGATAHGQRELLSLYGITEKTIGCPIKATMEVAEIGKTEDKLPVFLDRFALDADHIVVVNRVKPHTKFEAEIESGLFKMMAIGMGKHKGAQLYHRASVQFGMEHVIITAGNIVLKKAPVLCGVAIVENGYDETAIIKAILPDEFHNEEKILLKEAKKRMAHLPFDDIDILIVGQIGKNISGTGMDTNVTGINRDILGTFSSKPKVKRSIVLDLTDESEGNALGIGLADFTTTRVVKKMDRKKTYINCLTGISPEKGAIPIYFDTDKECVDAALETIGMIPPDKAKIIYIKNTLFLSRVAVSRIYEKDIMKRDDLKLVTNWFKFPFDKDENLAIKL